MSSNIVFLNKSQYTPSISEKFFIDTNVWLYLFFPQFDTTPKRIIDLYSDLLKKISNNQNLIITHPQMFSEFINVWQKKAYKHKFSQKFPKYKDFRGSNDFELLMNDIISSITQILKLSKVLSGTFNETQIKDMLSNCDKSDFNDLCFVELCKQNQCIMITHDIDYQSIGNSGLHLVTANNKIL